MPKLLFLLVLYLWAPLYAAAQNPTTQKLTRAFKTFQNDPQLTHGLASLYVLDAKTGKVVFAANEKTGLVPASTLKVVISATAYELLGPDFRYQTRFAYRRQKAGASLLILPSGDPTLGSWRWPATRDERVLANLDRALRKDGITNVTEVLVNNDNWNTETIPDGWLWQDIGNYYGAGAAKLNWRENQFDVLLRSGSQVGSAVTVVRTEPRLYQYQLLSEVKAAAAGSGDSAYIYFPLRGTTATIRGTIPVNKPAFEISGALPSPKGQFLFSLAERFPEKDLSTAAATWKNTSDKPETPDYTVFYTHTSPALDSMVYWLNRKSVNLYAEALLKTLAEKQEKVAGTNQGVAALQRFWQSKGIAEAELRIYDGSGLSPLNRVTSAALVKVLQHARGRNWYSGFYNSLPSYNGQKMKSGTMHGVKGYCGYARDKAGNDYIFAFLVNNYSGSPAEITRKMYQVLNGLK